MALDPATLRDDVDALKRLIVGLAREAVRASTLIEKLRGELARLKPARFGTSSEKLGTRLKQLELAIEALEAEPLAGTPVVAEAREAARLKPARRDLPAHLPRESVVHAAACPACGGRLRRIGEDVTKSLDYVPGRFKIVRYVREAFTCRACEQMVQAPAPHHAVPRGRAGPGLLAHIAVAKFDDHVERARSRGLPARRAHPHRRSPGQAPRRSPALELDTDRRSPAGRLTSCPVTERLRRPPLGLRRRCSSDRLCAAGRRSPASGPER